MRTGRTLELREVEIGVACARVTLMYLGRSCDSGGERLSWECLARETGSTDWNENQTGTPHPSVSSGGREDTKEDRARERRASVNSTRTRPLYTYNSYLMLVCGYCFSSNILILSPAIDIVLLPHPCSSRVPPETMGWGAAPRPTLRPHRFDWTEGLTQDLLSPDSTRFDIRPPTDSARDVPRADPAAGGSTRNGAVAGSSSRIVRGLVGTAAFPARVRPSYFPLLDGRGPRQTPGRSPDTRRNTGPYVLYRRILGSVTYGRSMPTAGLANVPLGSSFADRCSSREAESHSSKLISRPRFHCFICINWSAGRSETE